MTDQDRPRQDPDLDPQRARAVGLLEDVREQALRGLVTAPASSKPAYISSIATVTSKLISIDGRCGARARTPCARHGARLCAECPPAFCSQYPVKGMRRCRMHGGKTPRGSASPHYKHGLRSRHLLAQLDAAARERAQHYAKQPYELGDVYGMSRVLFELAVERGDEKAASGWAERLVSITRAGTERERGPAPDRPHELPTLVILGLARSSDELRSVRVQITEERMREALAAGVVEGKVADAR